MLHGTLREDAIFRRLLAITLIAIAASFAYACEDDKSAPDSPTVATSPVTASTPDPLPTIVGNDITSPAKGYAATQPEGWNARINFITSETGRADAFFAPVVGAPTAITPNIAINCIPAQGQTAEAFVEGRLAVIRALTGKEPVTVDVTVSGQPAKRVDYEQTSTQAQLTLAKSEVYITGPMCAYAISLTTAPQDAAAYQDEFAALVNSFRIL